MHDPMPTQCFADLADGPLLDRVGEACCLGGEDGTLDDWRNFKPEIIKFDSIDSKVVYRAGKFRNFLKECDHAYMRQEGSANGY
jgi:hypothetical protein